MRNIFTLSLVTLVSLYISSTASYITLHEGVLGISGLSRISSSPIPITKNSHANANKNTQQRLRSSNKLTINAISDVNTSPSQQPPQLPLSNANITSIIKNTGSFSVHNIPLTAECEQLNISSIYLNIDKVKGVYFAKDVKNIIFTSLDNLSDLYYYDRNGGGNIYKVSNKTRINMKDIQRFVFQSFNNNVDGILF